MTSTIRFKFRAELNYSNLPFEGHYITVGELKRLIADKKGLGIDAANELQLTDATSKRDYDNDTEQVLKNSSVIVKRVAAAARPKTIISSTAPTAGAVAATSAAAAAPVSLAPAADLGVPTHVEDEFGEDPFKKAAHDDQQITEFLSHAAKGVGWESQLAMQAAAGRGRGRGRGFPGGGRGGVMNQQCLRCGQTGHFINECPTQGDPAFDRRIKVPSGIPASKIQRNADGSLYLPDGELGELAANTQAFNKLAALMGRTRPAAAETASGQDAPPGFAPACTSQHSAPAPAWRQPVRVVADISTLSNATVQRQQQEQQMMLQQQMMEQQQNLFQQQMMEQQQLQQQQMQQRHQEQSLKQDLLLQQQPANDVAGALQSGPRPLGSGLHSTSIIEDQKPLAQAGAASGMPGIEAMEQPLAVARHPTPDVHAAPKPLEPKLFDDDFDEGHAMQSVQQPIKLSLGMDDASRRSVSPAPSRLGGSRMLGPGTREGGTAAAAVAAAATEAGKARANGGADAGWDRERDPNHDTDADEALLARLRGVGCTRSELTGALPFLRDLLPGNMAMADLFRAFSSGRPLSRREFADMQASAAKAAAERSSRRGAAGISVAPERRDHYSGDRRGSGGGHGHGGRLHSDRHYHNERERERERGGRSRSQSPYGRRSKRSRSGSGGRGGRASRSRSRTRSRSPTSPKRRRARDDHDSREQDRVRDRGRVREREQDREQERTREREKERDRGRERDVGRPREKEREREGDRDARRECTEGSPSVHLREHDRQEQREVGARRQRSSPATGEGVAVRNTRVESRQGISGDAKPRRHDTADLAPALGGTELQTRPAGETAEAPVLEPPSAASTDSERMPLGQAGPPPEENSLALRPSTAGQRSKNSDEDSGDESDEEARLVEKKRKDADADRLLTAPPERREPLSRRALQQPGPGTSTAAARRDSNDREESDSAVGEGSSDRSDPDEAAEEEEEAVVRAAGLRDKQPHPQTSQRQQPLSSQQQDQQQQQRPVASVRGDRSESLHSSGNVGGTGLAPAASNLDDPAASSESESGDRRAHKKHKKHKKDKSKDRKKDSKHTSKKSHKHKDKEKGRVKEREGRARTGAAYDEDNQYGEDYDIGGYYDGDSEDYAERPGPSKRKHSSGSGAAAAAPAAKVAAAAADGTKGAKGSSDDGRGREWSRSRSPVRGTRGGGDGGSADLRHVGNRYGITEGRRRVDGGSRRAGAGSGQDDERQDGDGAAKRGRVEWILPKGRGGGGGGDASCGKETADGGGTRAPSRQGFAARMFNQTLGLALQEQRRTSAREDGGRGSGAAVSSSGGRDERGGGGDRRRDRDEGRDRVPRERGPSRESDDERPKRRYRD